MSQSRSILALPRLCLGLAAAAVLATLFVAGPLRPDGDSGSEVLSRSEKAAEPSEFEVESRYPDPTPAADVTQHVGGVTLGQLLRESGPLASRVVAGKPLRLEAGNRHVAAFAHRSQSSLQILFCMWVV